MWFVSPWPHPGRAVGVGVCGCVGTGFVGGVAVVEGPAPAVLGSEVVVGGDALGEVDAGGGTAGVGGAWVGGGAPGWVGPAAGLLPVWWSGRPEARADAAGAFDTRLGGRGEMASRCRFRACAAGGGRAATVIAPGARPWSGRASDLDGPLVSNCPGRTSAIPTATSSASPSAARSPTDASTEREPPMTSCRDLGLAAGSALHRRISLPATPPSHEGTTELRRDRGGRRRVSSAAFPFPTATEMHAVRRLGQALPSAHDERS
jgi:hypothetical protein